MNLGEPTRAAAETRTKKLRPLRQQPINVCTACPGRRWRAARHSTTLFRISTMGHVTSSDLDRLLTCVARLLA